MASPFTITVSDKKTGQIRHLFTPTPKQIEILKVCFSGKYPNLFIWGNRGGGKSWMARWLCHILALRFPNFRYKIIRRRFGELQENHLDFLNAEMEAFGGEKAGFKYNKQEHTVYYANGSIGYYRPCASKEDAEKAIGAEAYLLVFDEAPTLEWEHMVLITGSVRVPESARDLGVKPFVLYLGNPIGSSVDQLWSYFIDKDVDPDLDPNYFPSDWHAIEMRLEDNPHQDIEAYRRRLASQTDPQYRRAWLDGERTYNRALFTIHPTKEIERLNYETGKLETTRIPYHVIDELPTYEGKSILELPWVHVYRAYDDGWAPDPAYCLWIAVVGKKLIAFHERRWNETLIKDIASDIKRDSQGFRVSGTFCDPHIDIKTTADIRTKKDMFESEGIPMECSINDRALFARVVNEALGTEVGKDEPRLHILRSGCPYLLKTLPQQRFDERDPNKLANHKDDHPTVTLAYFLISWGSAYATHPPKPNPDPWWRRELLGEGKVRSRIHLNSIRRR